MFVYLRILLLAATAIYHAIASQLENQKPPPGQLVDVGGYRLHCCVAGRGSPTVVLDHSLGGVEGYFLIEELSKLTRVFIYDRAGYGWSDRSPHPRTSKQIVTELDKLLTQAEIKPPYILVGDSFGSYNVRLYAYQFPEKVIGMVLTDGLHERGMLKMSAPLQALKLFFISGFAMSILGSFLGIIRVLSVGRVFELLKPELRKIPPVSLDAVKRSFCRSKHWITMSREMLNLENSARQMSEAAYQFEGMPIVNVKADSFFKPSFWTFLIPLGGANRLRDEMHVELSKLSTNCTQLKAERSGHFVWVDEPDVIIEAVKLILDKENYSY
ncbi:MAG: alpha/beta hydrolase [Cyanobacteriota bacterium]|nr:alpha/beta hydrolase [Cyanobacteriota bacterium]